RTHRHRTVIHLRKEHRTMNNSDNRRWALAGLVTVALWIAGVFLITQHQPGDHATGAEILAWYKSNTNTILFGGWSFMLGCLGFVIFGTGLRQRLADAAGPGSQLPRARVSRRRDDRRLRDDLRVTRSRRRNRQDRDRAVGSRDVPSPRRRV